MLHVYLAKVYEYTGLRGPVDVVGLGLMWRPQTARECANISENESFKNFMNVYMTELSWATWGDAGGGGEGLKCCKFLLISPAFRN